MIVTVSRQLGSDGERIARSAAEQLGLKLIDRAYVRARAQDAGVPADLLEKLMYEGQRTVANEIIQTLGGVTPGAATSAAANPLLGVFAPPISPVPVSLEEAARAVGAVIVEIAAEGNVLILGQGAQALLRGRPDVCHVLVVAPLEMRIARFAQWHNLTQKQARQRVRSSDEGRRDYLSRYHNVRWLDPLGYHLVINTGLMSVEAGVKLLVHAVQTVAGTV